MSCGSKDKLPKDVLPHDKMMAVMYDLMRSTEFLNTYVFSRDSNINKQSEAQKWHEKVFAMHKISRADFERSYAYYKANPELMRTVMDSLSKKEIQAANVVSPVPTPENTGQAVPVQSGAIPVDSFAKAKTLSGSDSVAATKKLQSLMDSARKKRMVKSRH